MLESAESGLAEADRDGRRRLTVWASQKDKLRTQLLQKRCYHKGEWTEHQYGRSLDLSIPDLPLVPGYAIQSLGGRSELSARSWLSWQVFHPNEPDENYRGWEWYLDVQRCPLYRRDLDLVAATTDGELAAFCTVWYDDVTRTGMFESVGTSPAHERKGLGKQIMLEGLRRLKMLELLNAADIQRANRERNLPPDFPSSCLFFRISAETSA